MDNLSELIEQKKRETLRKILSKGIALVSVTRGGTRIISSLAKKLEFDKVSVFVPEKFSGETDLNNVVFFKNIKELLLEIFHSYDAIICVMSLGALVRLISPKLKSKEEDPAVLCIDETGKFVISVLSGHVGGANELCREVARVLSATPVITTASDSLGTIPVDIFGREFGWKVFADHDTLVKVSSSVVNDEGVAIVQESGEKFFSVPKNFKYFTKFEDFVQEQENFSACLFISHREIKKDAFKIPVVIYRPPVLHVGIGFDKGVKAHELYEFLKDTFEKFGISMDSIKTVSTVDVKKEDQEFLAFSEILKSRIGAEVIFVKKEDLSKIEVKNPSAQAKKYLGIPSVSEASALFCAKNGKLLVEKQKGRSPSSQAGMTLAVAIEEHMNI
ncbi:MAG: cobalamin biosynthesis protein [Candidatus Calescibacterium sp.]|nr:cobalamin biosynthesis protein [Candidatus Calescibacterium sp.]MCX7733684.1 cobalamin biosynthesis protein [bacterium]